jgi:CRISPR system Cascade subunit CasD
MGKGGPQTEWLAKMAAYPQSVMAFRNMRCFKNGQYAPLPAQPRLRDFHMVGSGYDSNDIWQNLLIPKTSEGKKAVGGGTKLTYRYYLQDMAFAVLLPCPADEAAHIAQSLQEPVWDLYLGRKCCVPTDIIYRGIFQTNAEAKNAAIALAHEKHRQHTFSVYEGEHEGEIITLNDVPTAFGVHKKYRDRQVTIIPASA